MSIAIPRRARRALLAGALAAAVLPAAAELDRPRRRRPAPTQPPPARPTTPRLLHGRAHPHPRSVPITVGDGCVIDDTGAALCVPGSGQARYSLGNGRDVMRYLAPHAARVDMGATTTRTSARRATTRRPERPRGPGRRLIGGSGADSSLSQLSGRHPCVARRAVQRRRPRTGELRPDCEHIEGSNGNDTITGSDDPNKPEQYTGSPATTRSTASTGRTSSTRATPRAAPIRTRPGGHRPDQLQPADDPRHGRHGQPPAHQRRGR